MVEARGGEWTCMMHNEDSAHSEQLNQGWS